jgi:hypothetical protein
MMQVQTLQRKSLFEWRELFDSLRRQETPLPTHILTALSEFSRGPRVIRLAGLENEQAPKQW